MTWQEVEHLDRENTVVMLACGPIEYVMRRCAENLAGHGYTVVVAPTVPYVNALFSLTYPGSVSIRRKVVEEYLFDLFASFAANGFRHLVLTSQHVDPLWVRTAESVCERVNEDYCAGDPRL
jgi:creatinine amidohydrolase/Fe(II)-dependent formamide hydrolase-like protein